MNLETQNRITTRKGMAMKLKILSSPMWAATIEDRPSGLAEKLEPLSAAGANLEFVLGRRLAENPGSGVLFVTPLRGSRLQRAAARAGFLRSNGLHSLRIEGPDRRGVGARLARRLGEAGINLRGFAASATGRRFVAYFAFDDVDDLRKAARLLRRMK
jgi:hypothetical protein